MQSTGQAGTHSSQPVHCGVDHGVHQLGRADDAVHRAGLDAQRAADAPGFVDDGQRARPSCPGGVQRQHGPAADQADSRTMPSAPPGGQRLMAASPLAMAWA
jgi:hypothetical protein